MNNKFFLSLFLCFQILITSTSVCAMEVSSSAASASQDPRLIRLSNALNGIFGVDVQIKGDVVTFKGSRQKLDQALSRLGDYNQLRQIVVPFDQRVVLTQACAKPNFTCWQDCMTALGLQPNDLSNFAIQFDRDNCFQIRYDSTFNKEMADAYVKALKKESSYFDWISRRNPDLLRYIDNSLIINYGLLTEHFCNLEIKKEPTESADTFASSVSLQGVLKKLSAAAGSDLSLVQAGRRGEYQVRTVMHGHGGQLQGQGSYPTIEILIDRSTSMAQENRIGTINGRMPTLLSQFRNALNAGESLQVDVYAFDTSMTLHQSYKLTNGDQSDIKWKDIELYGGTDLTLVANRLHPNPNKPNVVVVGFTDGVHEAPTNMAESLKALEELQKKGKFAQPYLCGVGQASQGSAPFFGAISRLFAGSHQGHESIDEFCTKVTSNIPKLLESNEPLVLTIDGTHVTIRQPDAKPDIHTTSQVLRKGDSVMYRTQRLAVYDTPPLASASASASASSVAPNLKAPLDKKAQLEAAKRRAAAAQAEIERLESELEDKSEEK